MQDDYHERLGYLYGRLNYEWLGMPRSSGQLRLGRMRRLLKRMGDPHLGLRIIHVAGTKGKGSTSAMIAAALAASGVRTGLYCSPHLHQLEERFTVDGKPATKAELIDLVDVAREAVEHVSSEKTIRRATAVPRSSRSPRRWACCTSPDGRLGRSCSRSVWAVGWTPRTWSGQCSRSSRASRSTTRGNWAIRSASIATEKAGILKRGRPGVSGASRPRGAPRDPPRCPPAPLARCMKSTSDFWYEDIPPVPPITRPTAGAVSVRTWCRDWGQLTLPLLGSHQAHNVAVVLAGLDLLAEVEPGLAVRREDVVKGFAALKWPARVEVVGENPWLVIDGAHNVASAIALADTLRHVFSAVAPHAGLRHDSRQGPAGAAQSAVAHASTRSSRHVTSRTLGRCRRSRSRIRCGR